MRAREGEVMQVEEEGGRGEEEGRKKKEVSSLQEPNYDEPVFGGEIYSYLLDNRPRTLSMSW